MKKVFALLLIFSIASYTYALNTVVQDQIKTTSQRAANGSSSQDWFTITNWNGNANVGTPGLPANDTATQCNGVTLYGSAATSYDSSGAVDAVIIANGNAVTGELRVGSNSTASTGTPAALEIDSGTLTIGDQYSTTTYVSGGSGFMSVGSDSASGTGRNGLFYMKGGDVQALNGQGAITIGNGNATGSNCFGIMYMSGGTIECTSFKIAKNTGVTGSVYLSGGTITTNGFSFGTGTGLLTISGTGQLKILGDLRLDNTLNGYISSNNIIAQGGTLQENYDGAYTILSVTPEPATVCLLGIGALGLLRRVK